MSNRLHRDCRGYIDRSVSLKGELSEAFYISEPWRIIGLTDRTIDGEGKEERPSTTRGLL